MKRPYVASIIVAALVSLSACTHRGSDRESENARLFEATTKGNTAEVSALLKKGVPSDATNWMHSTALMVAAHQGHTEIVCMLLEKGADVNRRNYDGDTALIWAALAPNNTEIVRRLLQHGALVNQQDNTGFTPLMVALINGRASTAELLLRSGAHTTPQTIEGDTALMIAAAGGNAQLVSAVLESGTQVNTENWKGSTALDFAKAEGHDSAAKVLMKAGGKQGTHQPVKPSSLSPPPGFQSNYYGDPNRIGEVKKGIMYFIRESNWRDAETALRVIMKSNADHQDTLGLLNNYLLLGLVSEKQKKYHQALDCYVRLLDVARNVSPCQPKWQCNAFMGLGKTYLLMQKFPQATKQLEIAKAIAELHGLGHNLPAIKHNLRMARGRR